MEATVREARRGRFVDDANAVEIEWEADASGERAAFAIRARARTAGATLTAGGPAFSFTAAGLPVPGSARLHRGERLRIEVLYRVRKGQFFRRVIASWAAGAHDSASDAEAPVLELLAEQRREATRPDPTPAEHLVLVNDVDRSPAAAATFFVQQGPGRVLRVRVARGAPARVPVRARTEAWKVYATLGDETTSVITLDDPRATVTLGAPEGAALSIAAAPAASPGPAMNEPEST
jgi:hypothetical protein